MSAPAPPRPRETDTDTDRRPTPRPAPAPHRAGPWVGVIAGVAVLLASAPVAAVVSGLAWLGHAAGVIAVCVVVGLLLRRTHAVVGAVVSVLAVLEYLVVVFTPEWWPGPSAFAELGRLVAGAGAQIGTGVPPIAATPEILLLSTGAIGAVAIVVQLIAVVGQAAAAAGVPLLAVYAVPTALTGQLLPWWAVAGPAAGFAMLLLTRRGARRQLPAGIVMTAVAVAVALLAGSLFTAVGTTGRFTSGNAGATGAIGLNPFTALRGQLTRGTPTDLFEVSGLPRAQYMRALTLRDFAADRGFVATAPAPGVRIGDADLPGLPTGNADRATVTVENVGFRDYWLPLYGSPERVDGLSDAWSFDPASGIAYSTRQREESGWTQSAVIGTPSAEELRAATAAPGAVDVGYLNVAGVDPRVGALTTEVTRGRVTAFDKAMAVTDFFTGPSSQFHYSLQTAPGTGDDALVDFLTQGRTGYCEQFATAMAVMLRTVGVPSRVAVGFTGGTVDGDRRLITSSDAHAWVEVYFAGYGWTAFDPTPLADGRSIVPAYVQQARDQSGSDPEPATPQDADPTPTDSPDPGVPQDQATAPDQPPPSTDEPSSWTIPVAAVLALLVVATLALPSLLRRGQRRRRLAAAGGGGPDAAEQAWAEVLAESTDRGVTVPDTDTVRGAARRLVGAHSLGDPARDALRDLVTAVEAARYAGGPLQADGAALTSAIGTVREAMATGTPIGLGRRLFPRSVTDRRNLAPARTTTSA
ncbi:DUF3488 and transglutaminase-like domain-containing protein [Pseudonocardia sp. N23]|uniref:transglutaminase TgpA family protein n=1 Tax=Pseudonocardia sp. N23 TaxID=1987376 RepID=UPI000C02963A|nr:DUF3488 and transglutaminase-like domain-containing protein [Pseudonocardia sp. N23]GAY11301.1 transglutaminase-like enzyme [Pseudonocardia sp. N23]